MIRKLCSSFSRYIIFPNKPIFISRPSPQLLCHSSSALSYSSLKMTDTQNPDNPNSSPIQSPTKPELLRSLEFQMGSSFTIDLIIPPRGERQGKESDIWAVDCTVIEMVTGTPPWIGADSTDPVSVLYRVGYLGESKFCIRTRTRREMKRERKEKRREMKRDWGGFTDTQWSKGDEEQEGR